MTPPDKELTRADFPAGLFGGLSAFILFVIPAASASSVLSASLVVLGCGLAAAALIWGRGYRTFARTFAGGVVAGFAAEMFLVGAILYAFG